MGLGFFRVLGLPRGQVRRLPRTPGVGVVDPESVRAAAGLLPPQLADTPRPLGVWVAPSLSQPGSLGAATSLPIRPNPSAAAPTAPARSPVCPPQPTSLPPARLRARPRQRRIGWRRRGGAGRSAQPAAVRIPEVIAIGCRLRQSQVKGAPPRQGRPRGWLRLARRAAPPPSGAR